MVCSRRTVRWLFYCNPTLGGGILIADCPAEAVNYVVLKSIRIDAAYALDGDLCSRKRKPDVIVAAQHNEFGSTYGVFRIEGKRLAIYLGYGNSRTQACGSMEKRIRVLGPLCIGYRSVQAPMPSGMAAVAHSSISSSLEPFIVQTYSWLL